MRTSSLTRILTPVEETEAIGLACRLMSDELTIGEKNAIVEAHHDYYFSSPEFQSAADANNLTIGFVSK